MWRARVIFFGDAGCMVAMRSHVDARLSCPTPRSGCSPVRLQYCWGLLFSDIWVCGLFTYTVSQWVPFFEKVNALRSIGFFHMWRDLYTFWAFLYTVFSTDSPTPLLKNPLPRGYVGTPVSFALLVRCCGIVFRMRNTGTGSSGRVTQVVRLRDRFPIWRETVLILQSKARSCKKFPG